MKRLAALLLALPIAAGAESFTPCFDQLLAVRLTVIDSHAAPLACIAAAAENGHALGALAFAAPLLIGMPTAACAIATRAGATIIAPISPGPGRVAAALALIDADEVLGHELAHVGGLRHPAWMPFIDQGCER